MKFREKWTLLQIELNNCNLVISNKRFWQISTLKSKGQDYRGGFDKLILGKVQGNNSIRKFRIKCFLENKFSLTWPSKLSCHENVYH